MLIGPSCLPNVSSDWRGGLLLSSKNTADHSSLKKQIEAHPNRKPIQETEPIGSEETNLTGRYDYLRHHFSSDSTNNSEASQFTLISLEEKANQPPSQVKAGA